MDWKFVPKAKYRRALAKIEELERQNAELYGQVNEMIVRLAAVTAMETPNCANIGKRMAKVARGEG